MPLGRRDQDTPQRAFANATISGATSVVAAQGAGVKIRVLAVFAISPTILTLKFQSATTDISATFPLERAADALTKMANREVTGKVVLKVG